MVSRLRPVRVCNWLNTNQPRVSPFMRCRSVSPLVQVSVFNGAGWCPHWCRSVSLMVQVSVPTGAGRCLHWCRSVFGVGACAIRSIYKADLWRRLVGYNRTCAIHRTDLLRLSYCPAPLSVIPKVPSCYTNPEGRVYLLAARRGRVTPPLSCRIRGDRSLDRPTARHRRSPFPSHR